MEPAQLWTFLPLGYLLTVLIEAPILWFGLSRRHGRRERLFAGFWLTACTYPIVVLLLPVLIPQPRWLYLLVAETFAPVGECLLFRLAHPPGVGVKRSDQVRDAAIIVLANLASFGAGELIHHLAGW